MNTTYSETRITPCPSGFGEYQCSEYTGEYAEADALLADSRDNVGYIWELGQEELPDGMDDIRGAIQNEPDRVFGWLDEIGEVRYFGITEFGAERQEMQTLYNTDQTTITWADDGHIEIHFREDGEVSHELLTSSPEQTGQAQLEDAADTLEGMGLDDLAARLRERRGYDYGHEFQIAA